MTAAPSPKQLVVLRHAALGRSNREIGRQLWVSEETVKTHLQVLFRKLGAKDRAHAVSIALFAGYLEQVPDDDGFDFLVHIDGPVRLARQRQVQVRALALASAS